MEHATELLVEKMAPGGLGLARLGGEVILLADALPGETVLAELSERRRGVRRGRVLSVLKTSDLRTPADCPLAGRCGGCDFLHVRPEAALELKGRAALGQLAEAAGLELDLVESPLRERYRSRATLHLGPNGQGRLTVGFRAPGGSSPAGGGLVEFEDCRLLAPELLELVRPLKQWASNLSPETPPWDVSLMKGATGSGRLICFSPPPGPAGPGGLEASPKRRGGSRWTDRRRKCSSKAGVSPGFSDDGIAADFFTALDRLPRFLENNDLGQVSVFARSKPGAPPRKISSAGPDRLAAVFWPQWDLTLSAAPGGFTQVNPGVNQLMVEKILGLAEGLKGGGGPPPRALDLYSGLGNIALPLLKFGFAVTAVEQAPESGAAARDNARGLSGFSFIGGRSEEAAADLARQGRSFDLIILDPPRSGAPGLAPPLAALKPQMIVYLACHPAVLPRDLPALASLGFKLLSLSALDMFPRTSHLETLAVLARN